ncbi:MAG: 30S ribosomal protein S4e [Nanoarchaeota archaeon]
MSHLKRHAIPKSWPIQRKGTAFVVQPNRGFSDSLPVLIILRDLLKVAQNRKEAKKMIHMKNILINGKEVRDEKEGVMLFDIITLVPSNKNYRLIIIKNEKFSIEEIKENEAHTKIVKIIGKKVLKGKKVQLNLSDGRNFLINIKCKIGDSALINLKSKKIEKCLPLDENSEAIVFAGKHSGEKGKIEKINRERKIVEINNGKEKINVLINQVMVTN